MEETQTCPHKMLIWGKTTAPSSDALNLKEENCPASEAPSLDGGGNTAPSVLRSQPDLYLLCPRDLTPSLLSVPRGQSIFGVQEQQCCTLDP